MNDGLFYSLIAGIIIPENSYNDSAGLPGRNADLEYEIRVGSNSFKYVQT